MSVESNFSDLYGPYFTVGEFRCKCPVCQARADPSNPPEDTEWFTTPEFKAFMVMLIDMRVALAFPFHINSGHRCSAYNARISNSGFDGPHTKGAADVRASFERAYKLNKIAAELQMGIGLQQTGDIAGRYIHVDNLGARLWTY